MPTDWAQSIVVIVAIVGANTAILITLLQRSEDRQGKRIDALEARFDALIDAINRRFDDLASRIGRIEGRLDEITRVRS